MRTAVKVMLIIASSLVGIGIICLCLSFIMGGVGLFTKPLEKQEVKSITATFDEIDIVNVKDVSNNVRIIKSADDKVRVTYGVSEKFSYYVKELDGTLYIEFDDLRNWQDYIFFGGFQDVDLVLELPDKTLSELNIKGTRGDIDAESINVLVTDIKVSSGHIKVGGNVGDLTANTTSGYVEVMKDTRADMMVIGTTSGKITLSGDVKGDVIADNSSGGIIISDLKCKNLDLKNTSGTIKGDNLELISLKAVKTSGSTDFTDTICTEDMSIETSSGSINLKDVDAANYDLHTTSGSIKAEILNAKLYNVKSTSGTVKTPEFDTDAEGVLSAKTTSGSIKIKLAD